MWAGDSKNHSDRSGNRRRNPRACCLFILLTLALQPKQSDARAELEVEFVPGLAIPLVNFLVTDGPTFSEEADSGVGFGGQLHILLDDWEFGYSVSVLPTNTVTTTVDEEFSKLYNEASADAAEALGQDLLGTLDAGTTRRSGSDVAAVTIHHVQVGYRFYPFRERIRTYIPLSIGLALVTSDNSMVSRTLYGLGASTGIGIDYDFLPWLRVGGTVRYFFTFSESAGDITLRSVIANFGFSEDLITTTFHTGHVLHIALTAQITF